MSKTLLIAGKDSPSCSEFLAGAHTAGRQTVVTVPVEAGNSEAPGMAMRLVWNRPSPMSARSVIVQTENKFKRVDEALLIFDAEYYSPRFTVIDPACFTRAVDEMMLGYFYLVSELLPRFKDGGRIIFLNKTVGAELAKPAVPVLTAQGAFTAFGEHLAAQLAESGQPTQVTLVRAEGTSDAEIAAWLFPFVDSLDTKKRSITWFKPGARTPGMFSFLR